jgi:8-oxo-dGTP pyrophosphatase MutT (NUDIX family)
MTAIKVGYVDVYVVRLRASGGVGLEVLALRRAPDRDRPGSWEIVHGHIEPGERPDASARRELEEETGLVPVRLYNLSRVEAFFENRTGEVMLIPVFVGFVPPDGAVRLSPEHDDSAWLSVADAQRRLTWPRERRALDDIVILLGSGEAGPVEDVLRADGGAGAAATT